MPLCWGLLELKGLWGLLLRARVGKGRVRRELELLRRGIAVVLGANCNWRVALRAREVRAVRDIVFFVGSRSRWESCKGATVVDFELMTDADDSYRVVRVRSCEV